MAPVPKSLRDGAQWRICFMLGSTLMLAKVRIGNKRFTHGLAESGKPPDMTTHRQD